MSDTTRVVIPPEYSAVDRLLMQATALIDTVPPLGPVNLFYDGSVPTVSVSLAWSPCIEEHFGYYEVLYDTIPFDSVAQFVWDWTEDPALLTKETTSTTITLPVTTPTYSFRIRAWDTFGNAGPLSPPVATAIREDPAASVPALSLDVWPNPFHDRVALSFAVGDTRDPVLSIYDVAGRLVAHLAIESSSDGLGVAYWRGRDMRGRRVPSGVYFARLETRLGSASTKILLLR
jgi:hypothetical protein